MKIFCIIVLIVFCQETDLFEEFYEDAEKCMKNMTLDQKIGQMFFPRFADKTKEFDINKTYPGGFVLFGYDFAGKTEEAVINNMYYIQNLSYNSTGIPLGLAVDEEGGTVTRVSTYFREEGKFKSPQEYYNESGINKILEIDQEKRDLLRKFKLNVNLAPVADVTTDPNVYIYDRTLGRPAEETAAYIKEDVKGYVEDNYTCCLKHFPGYGNNLDTHKGIAIDNRTYEQFQNEDFKTFEAGIKEKVPMILVSHNIVTCKDSKYPASISKTWHDILRNELNHTGLILTDDISMDAIKDYSGEESPAVLAFNAGNDIILTSDYYEHLNAVINAANINKISEKTINLACRRVLAWKMKYLGFRYVQKEKEDENDETQKKSNTTLIIIIVALCVSLLIIAAVIISICYQKKKKRENNANSESILRESS